MFLRRLFRRTRSELPPPPRTVCIYYDQERVLVFTSHLDKNRFHVYGEPMAVMRKDAPPRAIGEQVLQSLVASRSCVGDDEAKSIAAHAFQQAGVKDIDELDTKFDMVFISQPVGEEITIYPMRRYKRGGHGGDERIPLLRLGAEADRIGQYISDIVNRPSPPLLFDSWHDNDEGQETEATDDRNAEASADGAHSQPTREFKRGDRVVDAFGHTGTITAIDQLAEHGIGTIIVRFDDDRVATFSFIAHGLFPIENER